MVACTPSIHVFLGRPLFLLSRGIQPFINFGIWWQIGERSPDMVSTGEIKYPGWTKTSTAARQFDIDLSRMKTLTKNHLVLQAWG